MTQAARDARAKKAIIAVVTAVLGRANIRKVIVNAVDDYSGEPSLYVNIHLKDLASPLDIGRRTQLRDAIRNELARIEEDRFPYLTVTGSYWEAAANERKTA